MQAIGLALLVRELRGGISIGAQRDDESPPWDILWKRLGREVGLGLTLTGLTFSLGAIVHAWM